MPKIKILPILISITIALIFFTLGRLILVLMPDNGIWVTFGLLVIFYAGWWFLYRRKKP